MNKIYPILVSMLVFVSCNNSTQHATLVQADSLMNQHLDSAYTLIKSLNSNDLSAKDNAYYSLLLTTAQYKKCLPIPSDSIINEAVEFYTNHFDQDKLSRALMYKGGVLADLNYNKLALECYKEAEKIADTTNYLTMGLLNFRMGELYQKSIIDNDEHIKRYKKALYYFRKSNNTAYENYTLNTIGQLYITKNKDSVSVYLNQALKLATKENNTPELLNTNLLFAKFYDYYNLNLKTSKDLLLAIYLNIDSVRIHHSVISDIVSLYSKIGNIDSAIYFAKLLPTPISATDTMRYYMMQEEMALAQNDYKTAYNSYKISEKIADSLVKAGKSEEYYAIDKQFDNQLIKTQKAQLQIDNNIKTFIIISAIIGLILTIAIWCFYAKHKRRILIEKEQFIDNLQSNLQQVLSTIDNGQENETALRKLVTNRVSIIKKLLSVKYQYGSNPAIFITKFDEIISINYKSETECDEIINLVNKLYCNIICDIEKSHPNLRYKEKLLLSLVCLEFSPIEMLVFLRLNSMTAVYNLRSRLLKKLEITSLEEYICGLVQQIKTKE